MRSLRDSLILGLLLMVTHGAFTSEARAFSDPSLFEETPAKGGSGGRQFTGAPGDAFTCGVCHESGEAAYEVELLGFPEDSLGADAYDLEIALPGPDVSVALQLEVLADGRPANLELPGEPELLVGERCDGDPEGAPAAYVRELGERRVVGVSDCGASLLRVRVLAPGAQHLELWGAGVRSDGEADVLGDQVLTIHRQTPNSTSPSACGVGGHRGSASWLVLLALGIIPRRARRRSSR